MAIKILKSTAGHVANILLEIGCIKVNTKKPYQWASGWKSPIYCDGRLSLSYPDFRSDITGYLVGAVKANFRGCEAVAGVATAGIPQGVLLASELKLPFLYVRPTPKAHGTKNLVEGKITASQSILLVEDLISSGGSSINAVKVLRQAGAKVSGVVAIFSYGLEIATNNFEKEGVDLVCLTDFNHLLKEAETKNSFTEKELVALKSWWIDPANWK